MLLIRRFEEAASRLLDEKKIVGGHPLYIGQEATAVPAISQLGVDDYLFSAHRNVGHLLSKGFAPGKVMAEVLGRSTGYNGGRGGSYHVSSAMLGVPTTSAIVGANIGLAGGAAYAAKSLGNGRIAMCMIGDSVPEEGSFYESVNIASLLVLPVVYICENNSGSIKTPTLVASEIIDTVKPFKIPAVAVDGSSIGEVYREAKLAVERARRGDGPSLIEARTTVLTKGETGGYRPPSFETDVRAAWDDSLAPAAFRDWSLHQDGLVRFIREVLGSGVSKDEIINIDRQVQHEMQDALQFAMDSPWPKPESSLEGLYPSSASQR
ncbi:MAG: thiamine pyrophosphate-dependent dehydrogenase E1 component subunit alpha [Thaumarchaeota archaeon]|nr:thiamine pyrophosphate-dependent dehydrogenase E1 component subunit alpha [Nitrososphaerota archaeon]